MKCHIIEADMMPPDMLALYLGSLTIVGGLGCFFIRMLDRFESKERKTIY